MENKLKIYGDFLVAVKKELQEKCQQGNFFSKSFSEKFGKILEMIPEKELYYPNSGQGKKNENAHVALLLLNNKKYKKFEGDTEEIAEILRELLHSPEYNEDREKMRLLISEKAVIYNEDEKSIIKFSHEKLSHLKIYMKVENKGTKEERKLKRTEEATSIFGENNLKNIFKSDIIGFKKIMFNLDEDRNLWKKLEEVISSFPKKEVMEKVEKLRLIQAMRGGYVNLSEISRDIWKYEKDVINHIPHVSSKVGPILLEKTNIFISLLKEENKRIERINSFLDTLDKEVREKIKKVISQFNL